MEEKNPESNLSEEDMEVEDIFDSVAGVDENASSDESDVSSDEASVEKNVEDDSYFEDDENWGSAADEILFEDEESVIAQQQEAVVKWDIDKLYDEDGKVRSKRSLKNNPPVMRISNSNNEQVEFVLTKDLAGILARHFDNTHRAYYGITPRDEMSFKERVGALGAILKRNKIKTIVFGGLLIGLVIFGFIF